MRDQIDLLRALTQVTSIARRYKNQMSAADNARISGIAAETKADLEEIQQTTHNPFTRFLAGSISR
jgi:hypothetical protein